MPVLRQKTQNINRPINVARVDTGEAELWQTISANAQQMSETAFKNLADKSLEEAVELGQSADNARVTTINPATGKPEALDAYDLNPRAQQAYNRVIQQRFETSISNEIKLKAKELSMIENISPDLYSEKMSQYLEEMINSASSGQYKNMIEETGTFYLASTKMNLIETRRREQKIKNKQFFITNHTEVLKSFQDLDANDRILAYEKLIADIDLQIEADPNSYSGPEINALKKNAEEAFWIASVNEDMENTNFKTVAEFNNYVLKLGSGSRIFGVGKPPEYLQINLAKHANSLSFQYKTEIQNNMDRRFNYVVEKLKQKDILIDSIFPEMVFGKIPEEGIRVSRSDRIESALEYFGTMMDERRAFLAEKAERFPDSRFSNLDKKVTNEAQLLLSYAISLNKDTTEQIATAVRGYNNNPLSEDGKPLSKEVRTIINGIHKMVGPEKFASLSDYVKGSYSDAFATKQKQVQKAAFEVAIAKQKYAFANSVNRQTNIINDTSNNYTQEDYDNYLTEFETQVEFFQEQGKPLGVDNVMSHKIKLNKAFIVRQANVLLEEIPNLSSIVLKDLDAYFLSSGANKSLLNKYDVGLGMFSVNHLRDYADDLLEKTYGTNHKELSTHFGNLSAEQKKEEDRLEKIRKESTDKNLLMSGLADKSHRKIVDDNVDWRDSRNWETIISQAGSNNLEKQINLLFNGAPIDPNDINLIMQLYNQYSNIKTPLGGSYNKLLANGVVTQQQAAFLETVSDLSLVLGSDQRNTIIERLSQITPDDRAKRLADFFVTADIKDRTTSNNKKDIVSSISKYIRTVLPKPDLMLGTGLYKQFEAYVNYQILSGMNEETISKNLTNMYNKVFVEDDVILDLRTGGGKTNLTLHNIFGNDETANWVRAQMEQELNQFGYTISDNKTNFTFSQLREQYKMGAAESSRILDQQRKNNQNKRVVLIPDEFSNEDSLNFWPHVRNEDGSLTPLQAKKDGELIMPYFNTLQLKKQYYKSGFESQLETLKRKAEKQIDEKRIKTEEQINSTLRLNSQIKTNNIELKNNNTVSVPIGNLVKGEKLNAKIIKSIDFNDSQNVINAYVGQGSNRRGYKIITGKNNSTKKDILLNQKREQIVTSNELDTIKENLRKDLKNHQAGSPAYKKLSAFYERVNKIHRRIVMGN